MTIGDMLGIKSPSEQIYSMLGCSTETISKEVTYQYKSRTYPYLWKDCKSKHDMEQYKKYTYKTRIKKNEN